MAPARTSQDVLADRSKHIPRGVLTAHPVVVERAEGAQIWDNDGKRYIDFVGGIGVLNVGHSHPRVVEAVREQVGKISHMAFQVGAYESYVELAARLNHLIGKGDAYKSIFFTTGAEAVENAVKVARSYTDRPGVIAFRGGFHGRTLLGVTLTGMSQPYRQNFGPFPAEIYHTLYPNSYHGITTEKALAALEELFATQIQPDRVAAVIIEPVQGDGGFLPAPDDFLVALREITTKHGIVLIMDEIQTGFGRTGDLFGFEQSGIKPDLVTVAKSLAGGLPLSGVVGRAEIMDAPLPGGLGGTYGGNAVACAAALAVLRAFDEEQLLERGSALGEQLRQGLEQLQKKHQSIGEVRGRGSMLAMEIVKDRESRAPNAELAQKIIDLTREEGLLIIKCGVHRNVIRFLAPLVTSEDQMTEALTMLANALRRAEA